MAMPRWIQVLIGFLFPAEPEPERTPVEVFDAAIRASRQRFLDLRAASSPLFAARDALVAQLAEQRAGDRERTQRELDDMQEPIRRVEANLRRLEAEVRDLEAERDRSASLLKSAQAREAVDRILAPGAAKEIQAELAAAREAVAVRLTRAQAQEQLTAASIEGRLDALEEELRDQESLARLPQNPQQPLIDSGNPSSTETSKKETSL